MTVTMRLTETLAVNGHGRGDFALLFATLLMVTVIVGDVAISTSTADVYTV